MRYSSYFLLFLDIVSFISTGYLLADSLLLILFIYDLETFQFSVFSFLVPYISVELLNIKAKGGHLLSTLLPTTNQRGHLCPVMVVLFLPTESFSKVVLADNIEQRVG